MSSPAQEIVGILNNAVENASLSSRIQALTDVSSILGWLHYDPPLPPKRLREYVLNEFERAAKTTGENSSISKLVKFYREQEK